MELAQLCDVLRCRDARKDTFLPDIIWVKSLKQMMVENWY